MPSLSLSRKHHRAGRSTTTFVIVLCISIPSVEGWFVHTSRPIFSLFPSLTSNNNIVDAAPRFPFSTSLDNMIASGLSDESNKIDGAASSYGSGLSTSEPKEGLIDLQTHTQRKSPSEVLSHLSETCPKLGVQSYDYYGDFPSNVNESYLRKFESEVAHHFGKEDAVFCLSGGMAQSIALMIHARDNKNNVDKCPADASSFACHPTSHLTLHENDAYSELLGMEAVILGPEEERNNYDPERLKLKGCFGMEPVRLSHVQQMFQEYDKCDDAINSLENSMFTYPNKKPIHNTQLSTLILELPHREIGGKLTPWEEVEKIATLCRDKGVKIHCDGARIFEASVGYGHKTLQRTARPFDTIYISFYKGIGALSGAMLMGDADFCSKARVWLRRMGGNLYTLLPYAVSCWDGFRKNCLVAEADEDNSGEKSNQLSYDRRIFDERRQKLLNVMKLLKMDESINSVVSFDPATPQTNIVHGYLHMSLDQCTKVLEKVEESTNIRVLNQVRSCCHDELDAGLVNEDTPPDKENSFGCRFELTMGEANVAIDDNRFLLGWQEFARVAMEVEKGG